MTASDKQIQWRNAVQNHQKGLPLPVLDPKMASCEVIELYQWEMYIQFYSHGASTKIPTVDVGDK
eukprot:13115142-Ditylum_brightwellii.AAC.1